MDQITVTRFLQRLAVLSLAACCILCGCANPQQGGTRTERTAVEAGRMSSVTEDELRERLRDFGIRFSLRIEATTIQINDEIPSNRTRLLTTYWKMLAVPACRDAIQHADARVALVDTWALCAQMQQYFDSETLSRMFGATNALA